MKPRNACVCHKHCVFGLSVKSTGHEIPKNASPFIHRDRNALSFLVPLARYVFALHKEVAVPKPRPTSSVFGIDTHQDWSTILGLMGKGMLTLCWIPLSPFPVSTSIDHLPTLIWQEDQFVDEAGAESVSHIFSVDVCQINGVG